MSDPFEKSDTSTIPADDPRRKLAIARPETDASLLHDFEETFVMLEATFRGVNRTLIVESLAKSLLASTWEIERQ